MLKGRARGQPQGFCSGQLLPHVGADARCVSLVLGAMNLLVSLNLVRQEEPEIIGNPSIAPPGGLGAVVDEARAFRWLGRW